MCSPFVTLKRSENTQCKIYLYGANVYSWICNGEEQLFLTKNVKFDQESLITGGIAFGFPFYDRENPQRVFSRTQRWTVVCGPRITPNGDGEIVLCLKDTEETLKLWKTKFQISYTIVLAEKEIHFNAAITNTSDAKCSFNVHLKCHLNCPDYSKVQFKGLPIQGIRELMSCEEKIYKLFQNVSEAVSFCEGCVSKRVIRFLRLNAPEIAIWNPGTGEESDLAPCEYEKMVAIETGGLLKTFDLKPNKTFQFSTILRIMCCCND